MALNPLYTSETLPTTSEQAIREFNDRYLAVLMATPPSGWQSLVGEIIGSNAPRLTFPISQMATKFIRTDGEPRFRTLQEKAFDLRAEEFDAGFEGKWYDISKQVYAYRQWASGPSYLVQEESNFVAEKFAYLLENGQDIDFIDSTTGVDFFDTAIPANLFDSTKGTFSNYQTAGTSVLSIANIEAEVTSMKQVKDDNGRFMNVTPDTILVPIALEEKLSNKLAKENLGIGVTSDAGNVVEPNPYKSRFKVVGVREFTDTNDWYLVDSKLARQFLPCVGLKEMVDSNLALRSWDTSSDFFKETGRIKVSSHIWYGFGLGFPHAIRKVTGA